MERKDIAWQDEKLASEYLDEIRGVIPLAKEQIEVIQRIAKKAVPDAESFIDLGCGDGILGASLIDVYPNAEGLFLDFSKVMIDAAKAKIKSPHLVRIADYSTSKWLDTTDGAKFDIIVSGFSIHHQPDVRKKEIYKEIYDILNPGGVFLNLEHVASKSRFGKELLIDTFVDNIMKYYKSKNIAKSVEEAYKEFEKRDDDTNILTDVETQCEWLEDIGFHDVDCFMKLFEVALFGGRKPGVA